MDETQVAPPVETQPPQPVAPPPPEQAPQTQAPTDAQLAADAGFMRSYTQSQQKLSAVAAALGIPKTSTADQFTAAIAARRQALAAADDELESNPALAARAAAIREREVQVARAQYGQSADLAITLYEAARAGTGPLDLAAIVEQHVIEAAASRFTGAAPAPAAGGPTQPAAQAGTAPERELIGGGFERTDSGLAPSITPDREAGPSGWFKNLLNGGFRPG